MIKTDATIINDLRHIAHTQQSVDLLNVHQGIPVLYKAQVRSVAADPDRAQVQVSGYESVCLALERRTTLLTDLLAGPVNASVQTVDLRAGTATLTDFRYTRGHIGDRLMLRVLPAAPVAVTLVSGPQQLSGTLADLSMTGVGVLIAPPEAAAELRRQAVTQLRFTLDRVPLELSGTVRYLRTTGGQCRVGITLVQTPQARTLFNYIHARQEAVLRELQAQYQTLSR